MLKNKEKAKNNTKLKETISAMLPTLSRLCLTQILPKDTLPVLQLCRTKLAEVSAQRRKQVPEAAILGA